jgi:hypothetical protein
MRTPAGRLQPRRRAERRDRWQAGQSINRARPRPVQCDSPARPRVASRASSPCQTDSLATRCYKLTQFRGAHSAATRPASRSAGVCSLCGGRDRWRSSIVRGSRSECGPVPGLRAAPVLRPALALLAALPLRPVLALLAALPLRPVLDVRPALDLRPVFDLLADARPGALPRTAPSSHCQSSGRPRAARAASLCWARVFPRGLSRGSRPAASAWTYCCC